MPNGIDTNYTADRATVLPSTNEALIHFSDQFQEQERQRRALLAVQQKAEQERIARGVGYIGDAMNPKDFKGADPVQRGIDQTLSDEKTNLLQWAKQNPNADPFTLAQKVEQSVKKVKDYSDLTLQIQLSQANAVAKHVDDPSIDSGLATDIMGHDAFFTDDGKGNKIINPNPKLKTADEYYSDLIKNHADKIIIPGDKTLRNMLADPHAQEENIPDIYDEKGNLVKAGGTSKVPYYAEKNFDQQGNLIGNKLKTVPYKLNGQVITEPVRDAFGKTTIKPVEVVPEEFYQSAMSKPGSISGSVNLELKRKYPTIDPDSPTGEMLKRKIFTDKVKNYADWSFKPNENQSAKLKKDAHQQWLQDENLRLAKGDNQLAASKFAWEKLKEEKKNPTIEDIVPLTVSIANSVGHDVPFYDSKGGTKMKRVVFKNEVDPTDLDMITANRKTADGEVQYVKPAIIHYKGEDIEGYYVDEVGNWYGQTPIEKDKNGVELPLSQKPVKISKERVADAQLKYYTKDDLPASSKGIRGTLKKLANRLAGAKYPDEKPKHTGKFDNIQ